MGATSIERTLEFIVEVGAGSQELPLDILFELLRFR